MYVYVFMYFRCELANVVWQIRSHRPLHSTSDLRAIKLWLSTWILFGPYQRDAIAFKNDDFCLILDEHLWTKQRFSGAGASLNNSQKFESSNPGQLSLSDVALSRWKQSQSDIISKRQSCHVSKMEKEKWWRFKEHTLRPWCFHLYFL